MKTKVDRAILSKLALISAGVTVVTGILGFIPFINLLVACLGFFIPVGVGFWVVRAHKIDKQNVADGLLMGGLGGVVYGVVSAVIGMIFVVIGIVIGVGASAGFGDLGAGEAAGIGTAAVIAGLVSTCIGFFVSIVVSALAGLITAALTDNSATAPGRDKQENMA